MLVQQASLGVSLVGSTFLINRSSKLLLFVISFASMKSCDSAASALPKATHDLIFNI